MLYDRCSLKWFKDTKIFYFNENSICLSASFGYKDIIEDVEYANAPIIKKEDKEVIIVVNDNVNKKVLVLKTNLNKEEEIDLINIFGI